MLTRGAIPSRKTKERPSTPDFQLWKKATSNLIRILGKKDPNSIHLKSVFCGSTSRLNVFFVFFFAEGNSEASLTREAGRIASSRKPRTSWLTATRLLLDALYVNRKWSLGQDADQGKFGA